MISLTAMLALLWVVALGWVAFVLVKRPSRAAGVWAFFTILTCAAFTFRVWLQFQPLSPLRVKWEEAAIIFVFLASIGSATGLYFIPDKRNDKEQEK